MRSPIKIHVTAFLILVSLVSGQGAATESSRMACENSIVASRHKADDTEVIQQLAGLILESRSLLAEGKYEQARTIHLLVQQKRNEAQRLKIDLSGLQSAYDNLARELKAERKIDQTRKETANVSEEKFLPWHPHTLSDLHDNDRISAVSFNGAETVLAFARDTSIHIYDLELDKTLLVFNPGDADAISLSPDGRFIAVSIFGQVRIFDTSTGARVQQLKQRIHGLKLLKYSPDGTSLLTLDGVNSVRVWNVNSGEEGFMRNYERYVTAVDFHPDSTKLVVTTSGENEEGSIWVNDLTSQMEILRFGFDDYFQTAKFSPDGLTIVTLETRGRIRKWNVANPVSPKTLFERVLSTTVHRLAASSFALEPDQNSMFVAGSYGYLSRVDTDSGTVLEVLRERGSLKREGIAQLHLHRSGRWLVSLIDEQISVWRRGPSEPKSGATP